MTWFSLPITQEKNEAEFFNASTAAAWLAKQPQANAPAMLDKLLTQLQAFNTYRTSPRERFKTLEVLRKTIFAVSGECQRRYENKPLPLLPVEQTAFDTTRQLWCACRVAYLHCLRACLDRDPSLELHNSKVAHRVLACLRMEQMLCYLAGAELDGKFWRNLHAVWASAEQLGIEHELVEDSLLRETSESTISGQYCMAVLLHLARPFTLSRAQFSAIVRWLARWREQAKVLTEPDKSPRSCCIALDLAQDQPLHDNLRVAGTARWLSLTPVLRKMRQRLELLDQGKSPESLKLGNVLSSEACVSLLNELSDHLRYPQQAVLENLKAAVATTVAAGLENIFWLLGGRGLKDTELSATSRGSTLSQEQMALFGHVVRDEESDSEHEVETWQVMRREHDELYLVRPAGISDVRLVLRGLLAIKEPQNEQCALAMISSLYSRNDGSLCIIANLISGIPVPLLVKVREKPAGKVMLHPGFLLPAEGDDGASAVVLPLSLPAHALSIHFYEAREKSPLALRLLDLQERGGDTERWSLVSDQRFGENI